MYSSGPAVCSPREQTVLLQLLDPFVENRLQLPIICSAIVTVGFICVLSAQRHNHTSPEKTRPSFQEMSNYKRLSIIVQE